MRKHTRLYAIVLTAFMLVGIMAAAAAAAAEYSITGDNTATLAANGTTDVELTLHTILTAYGAPEQASAVTVSVVNGPVTALADKETAGSIASYGGSGTSDNTDNVKITITGTGQTQGNAVVTVTWQGQTHTINVTLTAPVIIPSPELSTTNPSALTWGGTWSNFKVSDKNATPGTWTIATESYDILTTKAHLAIDSDDSGVTFSLAQSPWKPTSADLDALWVACGNTGSWKGQDITGKVRVTKVRDAERSDSEEYTFTFKGKTITLAPVGFSSKKIDVFKWSTDITADASTAVKVKATGPGAISWDVGTLPAGLSVTSTDADANGESVLTFYGKPTKTYKDFEVKVTASNTGSSNGGVSDTYKFDIATESLYLKYAPAYDTPIDELVANLDTVMPSSDRDVGDYIDGTASTPGGIAQTVILRAYPGPVTWDYSDLEDMGLTVKVSNDTEFLVITGTYSEPTATNTAKDREYTVKATNQYTNTATTTQTYTGDVMIWTVPTFDNSYIFEDPSGSTKESKKSKAYKIWKSDYFNTNSDLEQEIPVSNIPDATSWDVKISDAAKAETVLSRDMSETPAEFFVTDKSGNESKSYLSAKVKDSVLYLTGSVDRVPSGGKLTVTVTAQNHAGATSKTYSVKVVGTTPTLAKKNDMTLSGYGKGNSADIAITAGDPTITMTAKIEAKTAKKIFGIEKDIDLLTDGPKYGIYVSGDMANGQLKILLPDSNDNNGTEEDNQKITEILGTAPVYKGYAFKKLPIVVTATNPDIKYDAKGKEITDKKIATQKATLSTANKDDVPYWVAPMAANLYERGLSTESDDVALEKKETIYVAQKEAFPTDGNPYYFELEGHGPFDVIVKPDAKNGIKAAVTEAEYTEKDEDGNDIAGATYLRKRVTFTGTPSDTTKDVATAFSLTAKNPSTGKSAKLSVNFTAVPKPAVQEKAIGNSKEKPATVGKKVKVAPKITSNSKKIGWKIDSVTWNSYAPESGSGSVSQDLYDIWGLALDKKGKGSIEGTAKAATGTTTPLTVTMHAYTMADPTAEYDKDKELTTSDTVTATIYIVGEKPKLATKKVSITIADDGTMDYSSSVFAIKKLDNSSVPTAADGDNPEIAALGGQTKNHYVADMVPADTYSATPTENTIAANLSAGTAVKGLTLNAYEPTTASDAKYNTFILGGTPAGATKKETVEVAMNNWGTIQTDKLTVTIVGQTPVVEASSSTLENLPETSTSAQKVTFTVTNADKVGSKIKWKITSKPSSGVKAKLVTDKNKPTQATVEITTKKATAGAETGVTVSATDSDTKKAGTATVTLKVKTAGGEDGKNDTPTVVDDTAKVEETQTNEKALGEGEVHFGRERTAAGLTAAQRQFLADNGYVIAAVLPEIEVTEAGGQYALEVDELEEAAATGAELVYFAFSNKPTDDDEIVTFADLETGEETTVLPASRKLIVEPWFNVGTKYAPVIAVKAAAGEAEAATEEDVKAKAEEKAEEAAAEGTEAEGTEAAPEVELKEVKDKDAE